MNRPRGCSVFRKQRERPAISRLLQQVCLGERGAWSQSGLCSSCRPTGANRPRLIMGPLDSLLKEMFSGCTLRTKWCRTDTFYSSSDRFSWSLWLTPSPVSHIPIENVIILIFHFSFRSPPEQNGIWSTLGSLLPPSLSRARVMVLTCSSVAGYRTFSVSQRLHD